MAFNALMILGVLMVSHLPGLRSCDLYDIATCPHVDLIRGTIWKFVTDASNLESKCRALDMALTCVMQLAQKQGCGDEKSVKYRAQSAFVRAICETYTYAFQKSVTCLAQGDVQRELRLCFRVPAHNDYCSEAMDEQLYNARACYREAAAVNPSCTAEDSNLLATLGDAYLRPWSDSQKCLWEDLTIGPIATAPTTMREETTTTTKKTTTMATSAPSTSTTAVDQMTEGSSENVGRVKGGSSRVAAPNTLGAVLGALLLFAFLLV